MKLKLSIILLLISTLGAKPKWVENGLGFNSGITGSGFHAYHGRYSSDSFGTSFEFRFYDLKADELVSYDYYGNPISIGGISLSMITVELGGRYFPFAGKIANNFSPFVALQLGPNFVLDGQEEGKFIERWKNADVNIAVAGFAGVGASFYISYKTVIDVSAGYDLLKLSQAADGNDDYSGLLIKFTYSRRK